MSNILNRINPSHLLPGQIEQLQQVLGHAPHFVGDDERKTEIPDAILHLLQKVVDSLGKGSSLLLLPEDEVLTSQEAADFLGVSRPFLTKLTDRGEIPSERVGRHRRVHIQDLQAYAEKRNADRRRILDEVYEEIDAAGLYGQIPDTSNDKPNHT